MLNRIHNVKPLSAPRPHGHMQRHTDQLLVLIGDGSDADDVLRYFRNLWPEVESAAGVDAKGSPEEDEHAETGQVVRRAQGSRQSSRMSED
jgi:hypothetical protein